MKHKPARKHFQLKPFIFKCLVLLGVSFVVILVGGYVGEVYSLGKIAELVLGSIGEAAADVIEEG